MTCHWTHADVTTRWRSARETAIMPANSRRWATIIFMCFLMLQSISVPEANSLVFHNVTTYSSAFSCVCILLWSILIFIFFHNSGRWKQKRYCDWGEESSCCQERGHLTSNGFQNDHWRWYASILWIWVVVNVMQRMICRVKKICLFITPKLCSYEII